MNYPSLLFTAAPSAFSAERSVYEDVKLTSLLPGEVIDTMTRLCSAEDILARQAVFRALEDSNFRAHLRLLSLCAQEIRTLQENYRDARCERERDVLCCCLVRSATAFARKAAALPIPSGTDDPPLFRRFREAFTAFCAEDNFRRAEEHLRSVIPGLGDITQNTCKITGVILRLSSSHEESYMTRLVACADKLGIRDILPQFPEGRRIAPGLIDAMAKLYPAQFAAFADFRTAEEGFFSTGILRYVPELMFYLTLADLGDRIRAAGIPMTYPLIADHPYIRIRDAYDVTLLAKEEIHIVPNDVNFSSDAPFFYLTGANGGGKTTYLRTVAVSVLLFLSGSPAPCREAEIFPLRKVFTHFPRDERFDLAGRFMDEHSRVERILAEADAASLVLLNETYSTTAEEKALRYTAALAEDLYRRGSFGVYVTHHHAIAAQQNADGIRIPFLNVLIDRDDSNRRTFKVARQEAHSHSYAYDILAKYGLDRKTLEGRFGLC